MPLNRRVFINMMARNAAMSIILSTPVPRGAVATPRAKIKVIAFDAFAISDPRPVFSVVKTLGPGSGIELSNAWRVRQF